MSARPCALELSAIYEEELRQRTGHLQRSCKNSASARSSGALEQLRQALENGAGAVVEAASLPPVLISAESDGSTLHYLITSSAELSDLLLTSRRHTSAARQRLEYDRPLCQAIADTGHR